MIDYHKKFLYHLQRYYPYYAFYYKLFAYRARKSNSKKLYKGKLKIPGTDQSIKVEELRGLSMYHRMDFTLSHSYYRLFKFIWNRNASFYSMSEKFKRQKKTMELKPKITSKLRTVQKLRTYNEFAFELNLVCENEGDDYVEEDVLNGLLYKDVEVPVEDETRVENEEIDAVCNLVYKMGKFLNNDLQNYILSFFEKDKFSWKHFLRTDFDLA